MDNNYDFINSLRDLMIKKMTEGFNQLIINGSMDNRIPGNLNISFPGLNQEPLIQKFRKICISSGSACTTSTPTPSHVLMALGIKKNLLSSSVRIGISRFNTLEEINLASDYILNIVNKLKVNKKGVLND